VHASQFCDPKVDEGFWSTWADFEVRHGSQDTFREMLRIKRSVQALFNTQVNVTAVQMGTAGKVAAQAPLIGGKMEQLEAQAAAIPEENDTSQPSEQGAIESAHGTENPEEIRLGDEDGGPDIDVAQKDVPASVYQATNSDRRGALARMKRGADS
jgi:pre-mRNA-splicing factor SYF1